MKNNFLHSAFSFFKTFIVYRILGYFEYLLLFGTVFVGLMFLVVSVAVISNHNSEFSQKSGAVILWLVNFFHITSANGFIGTLIGLVLVICPLFGYLLSFIFRKVHGKFGHGYVILFIEIFYVFLITIDYILFSTYKENFGFAGFFAYFIASLFGLLLYLLSGMCGELKTKLKENIIAG